MSSSAASRVVPGLILGALSLLSAFLLFQVQPIISKFILPWFGGSPGVWTTCMLFFQIVLFAGYAYAHALTHLPRKWQGILHGLLLGLAIALLPIAPDTLWKPTGTEDPAFRILQLLAVSVGLPYFVLSSTSPLVQVWFTRASGGGSPWRLYALSNIGSLLALLSYPLFFEVHWDVLEQTTLWSIAFGAFVILSLSGVWLDRRQALDIASQPTVPVDTAADHPGWTRRLLWVLLPALASCVLLSATNHVCQDVAVIPFLWVVPLALYLLTFIICFEHERWYSSVRVFWALLALIVVFIACSEDLMQKKPFWLLVQTAVSQHLEPWLEKLTGKSFDLASLDLTPNFVWQLGWSFGAMFLACMVCHGELTRLKPSPRRLTEFYLLMSAGGALGGLFVSLGAPRVFNTFAEWPITLILTFIVGSIVLLRAIWGFKKRAWDWLAFAILILITCVQAWSVEKLGIVTWDKIRLAINKVYVNNPHVPAGVFYVILALIACCVLLLLYRAIRHRRLRVGLFSLLLLGAQATLGVMLMQEFGFKSDDKRIERVRNFYGMLSVSEDYDAGLESPYRHLTNGGIIHGMQNLAPAYREQPTSYYGRETGIGQTLESLNTSPDARVGVVGMGAGTVSCYAKSGHTYRFYDINPDVVRIAQKHFTYLTDLQQRGAKFEIVVADARLAMEREPPQQFDVLLLDAFSGDSVPVHLLTREAFAIYQRHMKPDGIIAVHITNSYLVLAPVIEKIAAEVGYQTTRIATGGDGIDHDSTDYILLTHNAPFLAAHPPALLGNEIQLKHDVRLWTDRYHNLLRILDIPSNVVPDEKEEGEN